MRVVTLVPSATEIVAALGVEPVGVSHECDYPPTVAGKPVVVRSRIDADAGSAEIDEQVARTERAGGGYEIDLETLGGLDPDLVVTQGVCDVCAVDHVLVEDAVAELGLDCAVLTTDPHTLDDVFEDVLRVGGALDRRKRAERVVADLRARVDEVRAKAAGSDRPRTVVFDWMDPVMVAGHWVPELVEHAGGAYGMAARGDRARPREWAEVRAFDPEVVVVSPCGFGLEQTREHVDELARREGWSDLTAVREGGVYLLDGNHYANRPGPRLVDTLEYLAGVLHPDRFETPPPDAVRHPPGATADP